MTASLLTNPYVRGRLAEMEVKIDALDLEALGLTQAQAEQKVDELSTKVRALFQEAFPNVVMLHIDRYYRWRCSGCGLEYTSTQMPQRPYCCERAIASHSEAAAMRYQHRARRINQGTI